MSFNPIGENTLSNIKFIARNELAHCGLTFKDVKFELIDKDWRVEATIEQTLDKLVIGYDESGLRFKNLSYKLEVHYVYLNYKKENEQYYHILQVNNTIKKIKNRILKFLCEVSYHSELTDILSYQNIDNLRTLCNNVYVIYRKDRNFEIQLIKDNYTVFSTIYLKVNTNGKYTLKWTIEEQNSLTDIVQTQQENTTLISCIVLLKTLLGRKGLKYSNENS